MISKLQSIMAHHQSYYFLRNKSPQKHQYHLLNPENNSIISESCEQLTQFTLKQTLSIPLFSKQKISADDHEKTMNHRKESHLRCGSVLYRNYIYVYDSNGNLFPISINMKNTPKQLSIMDSIPYTTQSQINILSGVENSERYNVLKGRMINNEMYALCEYDKKGDVNDGSEKVCLSKINQSRQVDDSNNKDMENHNNHQYRLIRYDLISRQNLKQILPEQFERMRGVRQQNVIFLSLNNMYLVLIVIGDAENGNLKCKMVNQQHQSNGENINKLTPQNRNTNNNLMMNYATKSQFTHNNTTPSNLKAWIRIFGEWRQMKIASPQLITQNQDGYLITTVHQNEWLQQSTGGNQSKLYIATSNGNRVQSQITNSLKSHDELQNHHHIECQLKLQNVDNNETNFRNISEIMKLYQLTIDQITLTLHIQLITQQSHIHINHSQFTQLNQHSFLFIQGKNQNNCEKNGQQILRGWMLNKQRKQWSKAKFISDFDVKNISNVKHQTNIKHEQSIGSTSEQQTNIHSIHWINQDYFIILYSQKSLFISLCQLMSPLSRGTSSIAQSKGNQLLLPHSHGEFSSHVKESQQQEHKNEFPLSLTTNMLHSLSYTIKFPFHAVLKITQFMQQYFMSTNIRITSQTTTNTINKYMYISFHFDTNDNNYNQNNSITNNKPPTSNGNNKQKPLNNNDLFRQYQKLFAYGLRLGKTILLLENITQDHFQHQDNHQLLDYRGSINGLSEKSKLRRGRRVTLISADSRFSPMLQHKPIFYTYTEFDNHYNIHSDAHSLHKDKKIIMRILKTFVQDPNEIFSVNQQKYNVSKKQFHSQTNNKFSSGNKFNQGQKYNHCFKQEINNSSSQKINNCSKQQEVNKNSPNEENNNRQDCEANSPHCSTNKLLIFSPNIIPTPKNYFYELVFDSATDVGLFKNNKKLEMIEKLGYPIALTMQCSLMAFLKWSYCCLNRKNVKNSVVGSNNSVDNNLSGNNQIGNQQSCHYVKLDSDENHKPRRNTHVKQAINKALMKQAIIHDSNRSQETFTKPAKIYLSSSTEPISYHHEFTYLHHLQTHSSLGHITPITIYTIPYTKSFHLYLCHQDYQLPQNNGILIYSSQGNLINRYQCEFGELLIQKFYHKKFIKTSNNLNNIFPIVGLIHLDQQITTISFDTQIKKDNKYLKLVTELEKHIQSALLKYQSAQEPIPANYNPCVVKQRHFSQTRKYTKQQNGKSYNSFQKLQIDISLHQKTSKDMHVQELQRKSPVFNNQNLEERSGNSDSSKKKGQQGKIKNSNSSQIQQECLIQQKAKLIQLN